MVFLDRDGVICQNRPDYVKSWEEFVFLAGVKEALTKLKQAGFKVIVVSNQSSIGRGITNAAVVDEINRMMVAEVAEAGGKIEKVYVCPHRIDEGCACRKPKTGLFFQAAKDLEIKLDESYFVGDAKSDLLAGKAIGAKTILVLTGLNDHSSDLKELRKEEPDFIANDLSQAVDWILEREEKGSR